MGWLDEWVDERFPRGHPVAVAAVGAERPAVVVRHAAPRGTFEIGSVSKGITGLLYADAVDRGEVTPATTLATVFPALAEVPAGAVTLAALSTHRSGLPGLPRAMQPLRRTWALWRHGTNPYGETLDELVQHTRGATVGRPRPAYSNLGFQLLGHAVAQASGLPYAELLRRRLTDPLGLGGVTVPATVAELDRDAVPGSDRFGRVVEPWTGEALGPAGGIRAPAAAMAGLAAALLGGSAPGLGALDPVEPFLRARIGAGWLVTEHRGRAVTWHNGGTGGFRSWFGLDRTSGTAAVVLSARSVPVDRAGFDLLDAASGLPGRGRRGAG